MCLNSKSIREEVANNMYVAKVVLNFEKIEEDLTLAFIERHNERLWEEADKDLETIQLTEEQKRNWKKIENNLHSH